MQASEKVSFIERFDPLTRREAPDENEKEVLFSAFVNMCDDTLHADPSSIERYETFYHGEFRRVIETTRVITAEDGSFLHFAVWGQSTPAGYYDLGVAMVLHNEHGRCVEGYIYTLEEDMSVIRTTMPPEQDNGERKKPFSIIDHHKVSEQLDQMSVSEDVQDQIDAHSYREKIDEALVFEDIEAEFIGSKSPSLSELEALTTLLGDAVPYRSKPS